MFLHTRRRRSQPEESLSEEPYTQAGWRSERSGRGLCRSREAEQVEQTRSPRPGCPAESAGQLAPGKNKCCQNTFQTCQLRKSQYESDLRVGGTAAAQEVRRSTLAYCILDVFFWMFFLKRKTGTKLKWFVFFFLSVPLCAF